MQNRLLIIGCGDVGLRVALQAQGAGYREIIGVVRSAQRAEVLRAHGISAEVMDLHDAQAVQALPTEGAEVVYLAPPAALHGNQDQGMRHFLHRCQTQTPAKVVYISTSGVYGDCQGATVTEQSPVNPATERARLRLDAEQQVQAFGQTYAVPTVILRVAGIYGPGRLPLERMRAGMVVVCPEQAPLSNRIHADDLASICLAALQRGPAQAIYNVADGQASTMTDYFYAVADIAGVPRPPCVPLAEAAAHLSPMMMSFINESRVLDCRALFSQLQVQLRYPQLSDGIRASLEVPAAEK